ncbi:MAG: CCA tRNA nucleotidyltransferase [Methanosarcinaceae archaeon]|nr:CCA tRNA nucleotidyltransferase [Methanosarcinaceae archaeon]
MKTSIPTSLRSTVLRKIKPTSKEQEQLSGIVSYLIEKIDATASELGLSDVFAQLVGSAARGTWISGTHDLDLFITFPEHTSREDLEKIGLLIAREITKEADIWEERYAEHPYINMKFKGFDIDLVPCFRVSSAASIKSAVDRTPFHNEFIKQKIVGLEDEVLLLKQFMSAGGIYGSELKTHGFSGYLTELLVIHFGSFGNVLNAGCNWHPGLVIDLEGHTILKHNDPLVVIDPTDPKRNVAAALSINKFSKFIDICRSFFENPAEEFFFSPPVYPLNDIEIMERINLRKSSIIAVVFKTPDIVDDVLYPQLYKMEQSASALLEQHDFTVFKTGSWAGEDSVVLLELESSIIPNVKKHIGPPVWLRKHAEAFKSKYKGSEDVFSMYIEDGKYVVDIQRKYPDARLLLKSRLSKCSLGKQLTSSVTEGFEVLEGADICRIIDVDFRVILRNLI